MQLLLVDDPKAWPSNLRLAGEGEKFLHPWTAEDSLMYYASCHILAAGCQAFLAIHGCQL